MSDRLLHGESVSDEQIQAWADEAERGYDLTKVPSPIPGRPLAGNGPGVGLTVRSNGILTVITKRKVENVKLLFG